MHSTKVVENYANMSAIFFIFQQDLKNEYDQNATLIMYIVFMNNDTYSDLRLSKMKIMTQNFNGMVQ